MTLTRNSALVVPGFSISAAVKTSAAPVSVMTTARIMLIRMASLPSTPVKGLNESALLRACHCAANYVFSVPADNPPTTNDRVRVTEVRLLSDSWHRLHTTTFDYLGDD